MSSLPEELYLDILLRLPVKSLLVCRYVCKSWFKLISHPSFLKSRPASLIFKSFDGRKGYVICSKSYDSLLSSCDSEYLYDNCIQLDYPFKLDHHQLVGSCNGLVCLCYWGHKGFACLWNPATKEYKTIPDPPQQPIDVCAFGYDSMADDYMMVSFVSNNSRCISASVYSLKSNSWKNIQIDPYNFNLWNGCKGVFVSGTFHWLVGTGHGQDFSKVLICLGTSNDKFVELQMPKEPLENNHLVMNVGALEGCLNVLVNVNGVRWEVWVMEDYGVRESWTKRYVLNAHEHVLNVSSLRLIWSFNNGEILLRTCRGDHVIYDTVHAIAREPKCLGIVFGIENYVESLVSVNSGIYVKEE